MPSGVFKPYAGAQRQHSSSPKADRRTESGSTIWRQTAIRLDDKKTPIDCKGISRRSSGITATGRKRIPRTGKPNEIFEPISEIKENGYDLTITRYKKIEYEEVQYEKPDVIIEKIAALESGIQSGLEDLKTLLIKNRRPEVARISSSIHLVHLP